MYKCLFPAIIILLLSSIKVQAQHSPIGLWNSETAMITGDTLTRLGANVEFQSHNNHIFRGFQYFEVKGALTYFLNTHFTASVGAGKYITYEGGSTTNENRLYEQITNNQFFTWIKLQFRLCVEQRWIDNKYYNRFRYRLNSFVPINKPKIESKTFFISAYDEVFFTNTHPIFQRNRAFGGFGYQIDRSFIIQSGITNQYDYSASKSDAKSYGTLSLIYRIYRKDEVPREFMPSSSN